MANHSEALNELAGALAKAQAEFKAAAFNAVNPFLHNKYADLGAVIEAARPSLSRNGLSVLQPVTIENGTVTVESILAHSSGQWVSSTASITIGEEKGLSIVQVAGKIVTYLRRYQFASLVGIYADEDTDGNNTDGKKTDKQPAAQPKPEPAPEITMTLDEARSMKNRDGIEYYTLADETLASMATKITTKLKAGGYTPDEEKDMRRKLVAIRMILAK